MGMKLRILSKDIYGMHVHMETTVVRFGILSMTKLLNCDVIVWKEFLC
jgi:hypothetical protein